MLKSRINRVVQSLVLVYWVSHSNVEADRNDVRNEIKEQKEAEKLVDWDYAGLQLINAIPIEDKVNYLNLCHMRRERQLMWDPNRNVSQSQEKYEMNEYRKLYNAVFSTKPPHLRNSEENYVQFLKDDFFRKQRGLENPKTSQEKYEWFLKKKQGSFFGGKYDFDTYVTGNFTARRRRRGVPGEDDIKHSARAQHKRRRKRDAPGRKRNKIEYQTVKVVDYLNERNVNEHYQNIAVRERKRFEYGSNEQKARAVYTSNESKKKPLYAYNERAIQEKERAKGLDYANYMADEDYRNRPKAYYFRDEATYKNIPKRVADRFARDRRPPKYKFRRVRRHMEHLGPGKTTEKGETWAFANYRKFTGPYKVNVSAELEEHIKEGIENMKFKQAALEATGIYNLRNELGNRTTYVLSTYRNFVDEVKSFKPYTFPTDPIDAELKHLDSIYEPNSQGPVTTPKIYKDWVMDQLVEYRKQYKGLTEKEPFAHYPMYSWENQGFDLRKLEDPMPPIWPLDRAEFNAEALRAHFRETETPPVPFNENEWDSKGREINSVFVPPTKKIFNPENYN